MATKNDEKITQTAAALLDAIKTAAEQQSHPPALRELAEAFALVAGNDPRRAPATPRAMSM